MTEGQIVGLLTGLFFGILGSSIWYQKKDNERESKQRGAREERKEKERQERIKVMEEHKEKTKDIAEPP
jgi:hypothetical protein